MVWQQKRKRGKKIHEVSRALAYFKISKEEEEKADQNIGIHGAISLWQLLRPDETDWSMELKSYTHETTPKQSETGDVGRDFDKVNVFMYLLIYYVILSRNLSILDTSFKEHVGSGVSSLARLD